MQVTIQVGGDPTRNPVATVERFPAIVGRGSLATVHLDDGFVSRLHCEIDRLDRTLTIRDLGSRHGTFVNGLKVSQAPLLPGDKLTVGITNLSVYYDRELL
jgi:pSer/pThr/pTyr-binding forkhead associated (FHA) protein